MSTINIEAIKKELKQAKEHSQAEHLEALLYEFVNLHEKLSKGAASRDGEMAGRIKQFTLQLKELEKLEETVRDDIRTSIRKEAENTAIYYGKTIGEAARSRVDSAIANLQQAANEAAITLKRYQAEVRLTQWKNIGALVVASVFVNVLVTFFLMPKPTLPLTDLQLQRYELGNAFYDLWETLPKEKKDWFLNKTKAKKVV
jgi:hypothetical protein